MLARHVSNLAVVVLTVLIRLSPTRDEVDDVLSLLSATSPQLSFPVAMNLAKKMATRCIQSQFNPRPSPLNVLSKCTQSLTCITW